MNFYLANVNTWLVFFLKNSLVILTKYSTRKPIKNKYNQIEEFANWQRIYSRLFIHWLFHAL